MSATDFLVSFIQLALIQNLPAMLLGSTRLCNKNGKHSMSVARAPRAATGLFLMILIKPGPSLNISQKGKRFGRLPVFIVYGSILHSNVAEWGNTGCFFPIAAASVKAALHYVKSEKCEPFLRCWGWSTDVGLVSSLEWNVHWLWLQQRK